MQKNVLIIDNYDSFTHNLLQIITKNGCNYEVVKNDEITEYAMKRFRKILISPGPGIPAESGTVVETIRKYHRNKSILGICLGHQAIAEAFGGRLIRMPLVAHGRTVRTKILGRNDFLFQGIPRTIEVGLYHSWAVDANFIPACLSITSKSSDGIVMAIAHKEYDIRGIQFHPESIMTRFGETIIRNWLDH